MSDQTQIVKDHLAKVVAKLQIGFWERNIVNVYYNNFVIGKIRSHGKFYGNEKFYATYACVDSSGEEEFIERCTSIQEALEFLATNIILALG